jgi:hypothetical protein
MNGVGPAQALASLARHLGRLVGNGGSLRQAQVLAMLSIDRVPVRGTRIGDMDGGRSTNAIRQESKLDKAACFHEPYP